MTESVSRHTEAEIIARRGAPVILGGVRKDLPALVIDANERWQELAGRRVAETFGELALGDSWVDALGVVRESVPLMVELLVAYDVEGRLGGTDWIRSHATPAEVWSAFQEVVYASFPFVRDLVKARGSLAPALTALLASSTSSPSPSGASATPPPSAAD